MGPTASGKTDLVATLHERFNVELISVDAAQVYRGMNIGTAKPDQHFLERYPHHLIDIKDPDEYYSAAEFRVDATRLIRDIHGRGKLPVLVGGTMFYFSALEKGLSDLPASDDIVRSEIETELERHGLSNLYQRLVEVDPVMAQRINHKDQQRVLRALEIYRITGSPPSVVMARSRLIGLNSPIVKLALFTTNRRTLHHRIKLRFDLMMEEGLIDEVKGLLGSFQCSDQMPSMRTVGYRQPIEYLRGNLTEKEMIDSSVAATRQLAKRQLTWLRQQSNVVWFDISGQKSESVSRYMEANPLLLKII
ncbi:MAG: tRNA (adenosine(37)-N6)-dimethylallyltransferase MiaA [Gammaproteobacteria bacterium]|nr:tRNA (adenosine(37)-N6)-dimethylallyltransferase MiaA [Gammaproteobacteria bacterium]